MKKLLGVFFGLFLIFVSLSPDTRFITVCYADSSNGSVYSLNGDVAPLGNPDGMVNVGDALVALRFALGLETTTQDDILHGDVAPLDVNGCPNSDGEITVGDALVILRLALGIISFSDCNPTRTILTIRLTGVPVGTMLGSLDITIDYDEDKVSFSHVAPGTLTRQSDNLIPNDNGDTVNASLTMDSGFDGGASGSVMVFTYDVVQPNIPSTEDFKVTAFSAYDSMGLDAGLGVGNVSIDVVNERGLDTSFLELEDPGTYTGESTFEKKDNVFELDENETISVDEDSNAITIDSPAKQYSVGDIIIGDENTRFAKKVTSISNVNGKTVMQVETPYLTDIFENGSLSFSVTPDWSDGQFSSRSLLQKPADEYFTPSKMKNRVLHRDDISYKGDINLDGQSLFDIFVINQNGKYDIDWNRSTIMGMTIYEDDEGSITEAVVSQSFTKEGEIKATITKGVLNVCPTIDAHYKDSSAWAQMDLLMTFDAEVEVVATGNVSFEMAKKILPKISVPITIPPTPATPPVYLNVELEIPAGFQMGSQVEGKAVFYYHSTYSKQIYMEFSRSDGFSYNVLKDDFSEDKGVDLTAKGSIWAKVYLKPRVTVKVYNVVGGILELEPYIKAVLTLMYENNNLKWKPNEDDLYLGIAGRAGLGLDLYLWSKDYMTPDLFNIHKSWDLVPICITPQTPTLSVSKTEVNEGDTYTVSWNSVANATRYILEESTNANFSGATSFTVTSTSKQFTHTVSTDTRYYYRVRADNEPCDLKSGYSNVKNVLVRADQCINNTPPKLNSISLNDNEQSNQFCVGDSIAFTASCSDPDTIQDIETIHTRIKNMSTGAEYTETFDANPVPTQGSSTSGTCTRVISQTEGYVGQYCIYVKIQDKCGNWSNEVSICVSGIECDDCSDNTPPTAHSVSLYGYEHSDQLCVGDYITFTATGSDPDTSQDIETIHARIKNMSTGAEYTETFDTNPQGTSTSFTATRVLSRTVGYDAQYCIYIKFLDKCGNWSNEVSACVWSSDCACSNNTPPTAYSVSLYGYEDSNQLCVGDYFAFSATGFDPDTVQDIETIHARIKNMSTGAEYTEISDAYPQGSSTSFTATRVLSRTVGYVGRYCIYVKFLDKCGNWSNEVSVCVWSSDCGSPPPAY
jgi:hypothetical protein